MNNFKYTLSLFFLFSIFFNCEAQVKEISIINFAEEIDFTDSAEFIKNITEIKIVNLESRHIFNLPDQKIGRFQVSEEIIGGDSLLEFLDEKGNRYSFFIPSFRYRVRIGLNKNYEENCVSYHHYNGCDAIYTGNQYGVDCEHFNFINLDFCENSPKVIFPGIRKFYKYIDYRYYLDSLVNKDAVYNAELCDSQEVFTISEKPAEIENENSLQIESRFESIQSPRSRGHFSIKFTINCEGEIVETKLLANTTKLTRDMIFNLFSSQIQFKPAIHRGEKVDSYKIIKFKLRGNKLKRIK